MLSVTLVLAVLIGIMNIVNFRSVLAQTDERLEILAENGGSFPTLKPDSFGDIEPGEDMKPVLHRRNLEMPFDTRYFTVTLDPEGNITATDTDHIAAVSSDLAGQMVEELRSSGSSKGFDGDYRYMVLDQDTDGKLYIFVDCTRDMESFRQFLYASVGVSLLGLAGVFVLVFLLSKRAIRPIAESYEKQKRFITDASHEIKTPLAIIRANTEVLEMTIDEDNKWIKSIQHQTDRLARLTERLVFLTRMDEENNPIMEKRDMDLSNAVAEMADGYLAMAKSKGRKLAIDVEDGIRLTADEAMMRQVVSLLLDNAMKYSSEGGNVELALKRDGQHALLTVSNSVEEGAVTEGAHPEFFDRFYRADQSRNTENGRGSFGIGLSVVQAIVDAHKGKISADCHNNCVVFTAKLPL